MPNIVIRHLSGTKANQVEEIPLQGFREILIGREANASIRFDADREDLVSRNHARIVVDPADPGGFLLTDLESRNGTFINRQRIYGASRLQHGDRIQLGPSGPEFTFELEPAPAIARPTRLADTSGSRPTREAAIGATATAGMPTTPSAMPPGLAETRPAAGSRPVGRATMERAIDQVSLQMKGESRKNLWSVVIAALVVLAAGGGYFVWSNQKVAAENKRIEGLISKNEDSIHAAEQRRNDLMKVAVAGAGAQAVKAKAEIKQQEDLIAKLSHDNGCLKNSASAPDCPKPDNGTVDAKTDGKTNGKTDAASLTPPLGSKTMTPEEIHTANTKSVVLIEAAWKITDTGTGGQIYLYHHRNDLGACPQVSKTEYLPMFVDDNGALSPVLSTLPNEGNNTPIVGTHSGSGFIVGGDGFFLTNRHVLAPWRATWNVADFTRKTVGLKVKNSSIVGCITASEFPSEWVPADGSKMVVDKIESVMNPGGVTTKSTYSDRLKYNPLRTNIQGEAVFNVTFAKTTQRYRAGSVTVSEKHDVALGKVDVPAAAKPVGMFTDSSAIKPGQAVVVMGYPAISPDVFGLEVSRDMFTTKTHVSPIADPTLSEGPISKVLPSGNTVKGVDGYISAGEVYQLGINTTGAGNSGGPVFDDKGRVIGIFYAGRSFGGAVVTYAVPIKFGQELIDNPSVIK